MHAQTIPSSPSNQATTCTGWLHITCIWPETTTCDAQASPQKLNLKKIKRLQEIIGVCRWYCDFTDPLSFVGISKLGSKQTTATNNEENSASRFMDYFATFPNGKITYEKLDMVLCMHSDGDYIVKPKAKSRDDSFFSRSNFVNDIEKGAPKLNGLVHVLCKRIKTSYHLLLNAR